MDTIGAMCESGASGDDTRDECIDKYIATWAKLKAELSDRDKRIAELEKACRAADDAIGRELYLCDSSGLDAALTVSPRDNHITSEKITRSWSHENTAPATSVPRHR